MKSICALGLFVLVSITAISQEKDKNKDKQTKASHGNQQNDAKIKEHERTIWAGTGVDLNEKSKDVKKIPEAVLASFRQFFPDQEIDNFRKYRGLYAITFSNSVFTTTFIYKPNGTFVEARTVATESALPNLVRESVNKKASYTMSDVVVIENSEKKKFYRVHLKKDNDNEYLFYDEDGNVVAYDY